MMTTEKAPSFVLSATLRAHGDELTDAQAMVVDVAQRLNNGFKERTPVPARMVKRILQAYHNVPTAESKTVIQELVDMGVIEIVTAENNRIDLKLVKKFKGLSDEELTEENAGIGVQVETLREKANTYKFCSDLLRQAAGSEWSELMCCSTAAGMLLAVFKENCFIDQMSIDDLRKACYAAGMSKLEFYCACAELDGMTVLFFYWDDKNDVGYVRTLDQIGKQYEVDASEALKWDEHNANEVVAEVAA